MCIHELQSVSFVKFLNQEPDDVLDSSLWPSGLSINADNAMGSHMGSLTTPTIGSTSPQSSRFDFSFEIVGIRWRMETLNTLHYRDKDSYFT